MIAAIEACTIGSSLGRNGRCTFGLERALENWAAATGVIMPIAVPDSARPSTATDIAAIPGLRELWAETLGDPRVCIAVLDGPVDVTHPTLAGANLTQIETLASGGVTNGPAAEHGTHVASIIFGRHDSPVKGIAPSCRGLVVPVFKDGDAGAVVPCSQVDLARAISQVVQFAERENASALVINISGGQFAPSGQAHPILADVVRNCDKSKVLIVAAAGNQGCECLHIPGAIPSVLAVGAMTVQGSPLDFSNWGEAYREQGVLAPGENILGASPSGGTMAHTGTSFATAIVTGVAALLLSLQIARGKEPSAQDAGKGILQSALGCDHQRVADCRTLLAGRLHIAGARSIITQGASRMTDSTNQATMATQMPIQSPGAESKTALLLSSQDIERGNRASRDEERAYSQILPSCGCGCGGGSKPLVYALGKLGHDFGNIQTRDYFKSLRGGAINLDDPLQIYEFFSTPGYLHYLRNILITVNLDETPLYAVKPEGPFAQEDYAVLLNLLGDQVKEGAERVSIPGRIGGSVRLFTGQTVPVIQPDSRNMYSWTTTELAKKILEESPRHREEAEQAVARDERRQAIEDTLNRIYFEYRNLGQTSQERALNYCATNALVASEILLEKWSSAMSLESISVVRSPICRPESDCWDVVFTFFKATDLMATSRQLMRLTVDVSDVIPVMIGSPKGWNIGISSLLGGLQKINI